MSEDSAANPRPRARLMGPPRLRQLLPAAAVLGIAILAIRVDLPWITESVALLVLITAVLVNAAAFGFWTGILSAVAGFGLFNFLFVEPVLSLHAARPQDVVMLVVFLAAAALTGILAGRLREQLDRARGRARMLEVLAESSGDFAAAADPDEILAVALRRIAQLAPGPAVAVARHDIASALALPAGFEPTAGDLQAAGQAMGRGHVEYASDGEWNASRLSFHPLPAGRGARFAIGHAPVPVAARDCDEREQAIEAVLHQASAALARSDLAARAEAERIAHDRQSLKSALLASLSHDLRTPLATILGAATTLRALEANLPDAAKADLLAAVEEEAARLAQYVEKLLQMTRLMAGLALRLEPVDPAECVQAAVARARRTFPAARIETDLPPLTPIRAEAALLEQALFNLIDNALRYAPGPVTVSGAAEASGQVTLAVSDTGPGLPPGLSDWLAGGDLVPGTAGTGLGLPICKAIAEALGGNLAARPRPGGGGSLVLSLPLAGDGAA